MKLTTIATDALESVTGGKKSPAIKPGIVPTSGSSTSNDAVLASLQQISSSLDSYKTANNGNNNSLLFMGLAMAALNRRNNNTTVVAAGRGGYYYSSWG